MEIIGKLIQFLPLQTGEGKNGTWKRQEVVIEQAGQIAKKVCISFWGDKVNISQYAVGDMLTIQVDAESREFNSKWYTSLTAWKVEGSASGGAKSTEPATAYVDAEPIVASQDTDELPF